MMSGLDELLQDAERALRSVVSMDDADDDGEGGSLTCLEIADRIAAYRRRTSELSKLEVRALQQAAASDGWSFFQPITARRLVDRGLMVEEMHPQMGMVPRITDAGRLALKNQESDRG